MTNCSFFSLTSFFLMDLKLRLGVFWSNNDHVGRVKDIPLLMIKRYASNILLQTDGLTVPEELSRPVL